MIGCSHRDEPATDPVGDPGESRREPAIDPPLEKRLAVERAPHEVDEQPTDGMGADAKENSIHVRSSAALRATLRKPAQFDGHTEPWLRRSPPLGGLRAKVRPCP